MPANSCRSCQLGSLGPGQEEEGKSQQAAEDRAARGRCTGPESTAILVTPQMSFAMSAVNPNTACTCRHATTVRPLTFRSQVASTASLSASVSTRIASFCSIVYFILRHDPCVGKVVLTYFYCAAAIACPVQNLTLSACREQSCGESRCSSPVFSVCGVADTLNMHANAASIFEERPEKVAFLPFSSS